MNISNFFKKEVNPTLKYLEEGDPIKVKMEDGSILEAAFKEYGRQESVVRPYYKEGEEPSKRITVSNASITLSNCG